MRTLSPNQTHPAKITSVDLFGFISRVQLIRPSGTDRVISTVTFSTRYPRIHSLLYGIMKPFLKNINLNREGEVRYEKPGVRWLEQT